MRQGLDIKVFSCNGTLTEIVEEPISKLLPVAFGPQNLGFNKAQLRRMRVTLDRTVSRLLKIALKQKRRR